MDTCSPAQSFKPATTTLSSPPSLSALEGGVLARCAGGGLAAQTDGAEINGGVNEGRKRGRLSRVEAKSGAPTGWVPVPRRTLVAAVVEMTWRGRTAMHRGASADRATEDPQRHFERGGTLERTEGGRAGRSQSILSCIKKKTMEVGGGAAGW